MARTLYSLQGYRMCISALLAVPRPTAEYVNNASHWSTSTYLSRADNDNNMYKHRISAVGLVPILRCGCTSVDALGLACEDLRSAKGTASHMS